MHEMGVVKGVLDAAEDAARRESALRINEIYLRVGELTDIVDDALQFAFEALSPGTLAEGGRLIVERVGPRSRCMQCDTSFDHGRFDVTCPACDSFLCELLQGRELAIDSIDIDLPEPRHGEENR